jgi:hypothetical protein
MTIKLRYLSLLAAAALVACAQNPQAPTAAAPAPAAAAPAATAAAAAPVGGSSFFFPDFGKNPGKTNQGADFVPVQYSERKGDASPPTITLEGEVSVLRGEIGNKKGSQYAGVALQLTHGGSAVKDLSAFKAVRIKLGSPTVGSLRVRIASDDSKVVNAGCYPVFIQSVKAELTEYTIPLSKFAPEDYCGPNGRTIKNTIDKVMFMEIADTANTRNKPTEFSVGKIEYVQ